MIHTASVNTVLVVHDGQMILNLINVLDAAKNSEILKSTSPFNFKYPFLYGNHCAELHTRILIVEKFDCKNQSDLFLNLILGFLLLARQ